MHGYEYALEITQWTCMLQWRNWRKLRSEHACIQYALEITQWTCMYTIRIREYAVNMQVYNAPPPRIREYAVNMHVYNTH